MITRKARLDFSPRVMPPRPDFVKLAIGIGVTLALIALTALAALLIYAATRPDVFRIERSNGSTRGGSDGLSVRRVNNVARGKNAGQNAKFQIRGQGRPLNPPGDRDRLVQRAWPL